MSTESQSNSAKLAADQIQPCADDVFKNGFSVCMVGGVPKQDAETICKSLSVATGWKIDWHYYAGRVHIMALAPGPQPSGEMVGYCRAANIERMKAGQLSGFMVEQEQKGEVCVPLFTRADPGEVERLREDLSKYIARANDFAAKMQGAQSEAGTLRAQLAERDALLADIEKRHWSGVDFDLPADLVARIKGLSASAEPTAPTRDPKLIGIVHTPPAEYDEP